MKHERHNSGLHRVVVGDRVGNWTMYTGIAQLTVGPITYYACTDYYEESLPVGKVFTIKEVG